MMKKLVFIYLIILGSLVNAQTVVIEDTEPEKIYEETQWGPNKLHFGYYFVNYGLPVAIENSNNLKISTSGHWNYGYAYNLKLLKFTDLGVELSYSNYFYELDKKSREKIDKSEDSWDKIRTKQNGIKTHLFLRFYLNSKRGNYFGTYVDLGAYADYNFGSGWIYKRKNDLVRERISYQQNKQFEELPYGPTFSFGRNQISIFGQYNLNSVLTSKTIEETEYPVMPKYVFGLKLNLYSAY